MKCTYCLTAAIGFSEWSNWTANSFCNGSETFNVINNTIAFLFTLCGTDYKQELRTTKNYCNFEYPLHKLLHQAVTATYNSLYIAIIHLVQFKVALIEA